MAAGCRNGYGVYVWGSSQSREQAWKHQYVDNFACKQCAPGEVPFLPGSNLELVCDGDTWTIQLIHTGSSHSSGQSAWYGTPDEPDADVQVSLQGGAPSVAVAAAASASEAAAATAADAARLAYFSEPQSAAVQSFYAKVAYYSDYYSGHHGGCSEPPVYPGQCVMCPEGSHQEGYRCEL